MSFAVQRLFKGSNFAARSSLCEWLVSAPSCRLTARPDLRRRRAGGPFQGSVAAFSASTNPSIAHSPGAACAYLLGMQSEREWARAGRLRRSAPIPREPPRMRGSVCRSAFQPYRNLAASPPGYRLGSLGVPANLLLSPATLTVLVASRIAARLGLARTAAWLDRHRPFFDTAVAREVSWLVTTELLQLPCAQPRRTYAEDALADAILSDPRVAGRICIGDVPPAEARARIATAISGYAGTRAATAEIATGSIAAGIGAH